MIAVVALLTSQASFNTEALLREMYDLDRLTRQSRYGYRTVEASSFDRASVSPSAESWFANADYGKYLRTEVNEGRTEYVMGDFEGPGAMVRFWSANPRGIVRFYFGGSSKPLVEEKMADLLQGKVKQWGDDYSYNSARGTNLYFPFPFASRLKVTVSPTEPSERLDGLYYQLNTRLYDPGTPAMDFKPRDEWGLVPRRPLPLTSSHGLEGMQKMNMAPGQAKTVEFKAKTPSQISQVAFEIPNGDSRLKISDPRSLESQMKHIEVCVAVDGQETIRVPLPDLVGAGMLPGKLKTLASSVEGNVVAFNLPMPFKHSATIMLVNHGVNSVTVRMKSHVEEAPRTDYILHAQWTADTGRSRPMRDMNLVNFFGEGRYVGTVMHVQNPTQAWWGEGDEKVWVDGERFPSWIGTGTEDYFGYAWSNPEVFSRPYHGQARADGPGCGGQIGNVRWHVMDDIPFKKKIRFDIEQWHWEDVPSRFDMTAFWYAKPGKWTAPALDLEGLKIIEGPKPPVPVKGAIEGETMRVVSVSGGKTERQGFAGLSSGEQLWWKEGKDGDSLVLEFDSGAAGSRRLSANLCHARDYGVQEVFVNGVSLGVFDFYNPDLVWKVLDLGKVSLRKGKNELRVVCRASNPKANPPSRMFGLDYMLIK